MCILLLIQELYDYKTPMNVSGPVKFVYKNVDFSNVTVTLSNGSKVWREIGVNTVEPPSKGHFGTNNSVHCREAVLFSEVSKCIIAMGISYFWDITKCPL